MADKDRPFGLGLATAIPEDWIPVEAFVIVKCLTGDGTTWFLSRTEGMADMEVLGALRAATLIQESGVCARFVEETDEED